MTAVPASPARVTTEAVLHAVADHFSVRVAEILSHDRHRTIAKARHFACWLLREVCHSSYPEIGRTLGQRDHTSAMHSVRLIGADPHLLRVAEELARGLERTADVPASGPMVCAVPTPEQQEEMAREFPEFVRPRTEPTAPRDRIFAVTLPAEEVEQLLVGLRNGGLLPGAGRDVAGQVRARLYAQVIAVLRDELGTVAHRADEASTFRALSEVHPPEVVREALATSAELAQELAR